VERSFTTGRSSLLAIAATPLSSAHVTVIMCTLVNGTAPPRIPARPGGSHDPAEPGGRHTAHPSRH